MSIVTYDKDSKVMFFIDLRNIINGAHKAAGMKDICLDFEVMVNDIADGRRIVGAYIFDGAPEGRNKEKMIRFHQYLQHQGFRLITREAYESDTREQKEVDVSMACKMLRLKDNFDVAVVVSGDRDFVPAIEELKDCGKIVEVASYENSMSNSLERNADMRYYLDSIPMIIMDAYRPEKEEDESGEITLSSDDDTAEAI